MTVESMRPSHRFAYETLNNRLRLRGHPLVHADYFCRTGAMKQRLIRRDSLMKPSNGQFYVVRLEKAASDAWSRGGRVRD